jgi:hypothetical protein
VKEWLGCPDQASAVQVTFAEQPFEYGRMLWDSETVQVLVLSFAGTWQAYDDTWVEGVDPAWDPALPPPPEQPQRGFGKVWREQLGGPNAEIGWALEGERGVDGWRQSFENGLLVWTDSILPGQTTPGAVYLLYDDGSWEAKADPGP